MLNLRLITIGALMMGLGSWFINIQNSAWVRGNLPAVADFFTTLNPWSMVIVLIGAVIISFGIFWGRWGFALILGIIFSLVVFVISFWPA